MVSRIATTAGMPKPRPRSAVSARVRSIPASGIRRFFDILATMENVISLGVGEPDFVTPIGFRNAAVRSIRAGETSYTSNYGLLELRQALAQHLVERYQVEYDPKREMIITIGASQALDLALRAILDPGDEVIMADPTYVSYAPTTLLAGGEPVYVPSTPQGKFKITADEVAARVTPRTKAILLGYPCNPTGAVLTHDELLDIALVAEENDLLVISDEIYDRLVYGGHQHTCFASLPGMRDRTILLGGFSKAYAMTGWRIGYAAARPDILEGMMKVHQYTIMCAPTVAQYAALEALRVGEPAVQRMVEAYDRRRHVMVDGFNRLGLTCFEPEGAFYAFPSVASTGLSSEEFAERLLLEERVAVVPGTAFGPAGDGHVRCCYATSLKNIKEVLVRLERFLERRRPV